MFNYQQLFDAIEAVGCPDPAAHYAELLARDWRGHTPVAGCTWPRRKDEEVAANRFYYSPN